MDPTLSLFSSDPQSRAKVANHFMAAIQGSVDIDKLNQLNEEYGKIFRESEKQEGLPVFWDVAKHYSQRIGREMDITVITQKCIELDHVFKRVTQAWR
jgi:hypothetical protein